MKRLVRIIDAAQRKPLYMKGLFGLYLVLAACTGFALPQDVAHGGFGFPLFWSLFALCGCVVIAGASKWIAKVFLERDYGYYDS